MPQPPLDLVLGYLESGGFRELEVSRDQNYVVVNRPDVGGSYNTHIVWIVPNDVEPSTYPPILRPLIDRLLSRHPDANGTVLLPSGGGFSRPMQQELTNKGIRVRVPIQYFDASFKVEEAPRAASAIKEIRDDDAPRVRQPYQLTDYRDSVVDEGEDLLTRLASPRTTDGDSLVQLIVGRAGIGKTVLSGALFRNLYDRFLAAKKRRSIGSRPIPLLPEHMKGIHAVRTDLLIDNFLRTDVATPVPRETFKWLLVHGFTTWLLDGLDELIAGDPDFFEYILDVITTPQSSARILIWSRDSLITTSDAFMDFKKQYHGAIEVYRLQEWKREQKREFAWLQSEGHVPARDERDPSQVIHFVDRVERPPVRDFSGIPFYCRVLWEDVDSQDIDNVQSEVQLLDRLIDRMLYREIEEKRLIDKALFVADGVREWLEVVAMDYVEGSGNIDQDTAREYGRMVLHSNVTEEQKEDVLLALLRCPFFVQSQRRERGEISGGISFAHDLIAEAVASRAYARNVTENPVRVAARIMERINFEDPILLRLIAQQLSTKDAVSPIVDAMKASGNRRGEYRLLLALLLTMTPDRDVIQRYSLPLEDALLADLHFCNLDLRGVSFRRSDLSHTLFEECLLDDGRFEGSFMRGTSFVRSSVRGADFGSMERIESIQWNRRFVDEDDKIEQCLVEHGRGARKSLETCPAARQLCHLFGKFVTAMGEKKRRWLKREGIVAGRQYSGVTPKIGFQEAAKHGYFSGPDQRKRYCIASGEKYGEIVRLVRDSKVSEGLGTVIADVCSRPGCTHELRIPEDGSRAVGRG